MAKRTRNKSNKKKTRKTEKPVYAVTRNWTAVAALLKTGGGAHNDRRTRRQRTRGDQRRAALQEY